MTPRKQITSKYPSVKMVRDWGTGGHKATDNKQVFWSTLNGNPADAWDALHYDMTHGYIKSYSL